MKNLLKNSYKKIEIVKKLLAQNTITFEQAIMLVDLEKSHATELLNGESGVKFIKTNLEDAVLIQPQVFGDHRGFFVESYSKKTYEEAGITSEFVQDNHSMSAQKGVLRGLHFQVPPYDQAKLVRVTKGAVYDVIVDLRVGSPTYGQWEGFVISAENALTLFVPRGFAHGFCTLEENTEFMYKVDNTYSPSHDSGLIWDDKMLNINWPTTSPITSDKDKDLQEFKNFESPFRKY